MFHECLEIFLDELRCEVREGGGGYLLILDEYFGFFGFWVTSYAIRRVALARLETVFVAFN